MPGSGSQAVTAADAVAVIAASRRRPSSADAPAGSPSTPFGLTAAIPPARSSAMTSRSGRVSPISARSARTVPGCRWVSSEVS